MTVCRGSVATAEADDNDGGITSSMVGSVVPPPTSLSPHPQQQTNCNNLIINAPPSSRSKRQINLSLPLEQYKQYNKDIDLLNGNGLAIDNGGRGGTSIYSSTITETLASTNKGSTNSNSATNINNNHTNCARSCSDVFTKRKNSFSLRLDMSPAMDGGDASSRKALFTPEEVGNMEIRRRRHDSPDCDKEARLVLKSGVLNAKEVNVEEKGQRYFADIFTTLVDMRWRWTMFYFCISYVLSWLGFAVIWWTILKSHGDMEHFEEEGWDPCVVGVKSFSSVFLFSLESQHTIGYGYHRMTDVCPEAIALLCFQSIAGVLIEAISVGVFIVKISKPKKRSQTLIFSKNALICQKDGHMYLKFRMADIRHESKLLETHVRAQVVYKKTAPDGEVESIVQKELQVGAMDEDEDRILLYWPTTIVHEINKESPFYDMTCDDLTKAQMGTNGTSEWELIAVLEGVVESTGMTTQARTSYLPSEILWGRKFRSMMRSKGGSFIVDFDLFNSTISCDETTLCSAKNLKESRKKNEKRRKDSSSSSSSGSSSSSADDNDEEAAVGKREMKNDPPVGRRMGGNQVENPVIDTLPLS